MKTVKFLTVIFIALAFSMQENLMAQTDEGNEKGGDHKAFMNKEHFGGAFEMMIPNLTEDQKTKIKSLQLTHFKEIRPLKNQLGELKAKERTLTSVDKPDMKAINANIDEITKVQNEIMKARESHHQQIRALLTDEQRVYFDMHGMKMMNHMGKDKDCKVRQGGFEGHPSMHN